MPIIEEVNDDGDGGSQSSASHSGSGGHARDAGDSASTSAVSRLTVCVVSVSVITRVLEFLILTNRNSGSAVMMQDFCSKKHTLYRRVHGSKLHTTAS